MIAHHPEAGLLMAWAAGKLDTGRGAVIAAHVELCAQCAREAHGFVQHGGMLLESTDPMALAPDSFQRTLERLDKTAAPIGQADAEPASRIAHLPVSLRRCVLSPWRWAGPGVHLRKVRVPYQSGGSVFLIRVAGGTAIPSHTHGGDELTQVLTGSFDDGRAHFAAGDFDETDQHVSHRPIVVDGEDCLCLAFLAAPARFESFLAQSLARWAGL
jgi:putative transcriptional regulator